MRRPDALGWRDWARRRHSTHLVLKGAVLLVGVVLVAAGAVMLVLPGPGWAAILLGLVVLGSEFDAAARLRHRLHETLRSGWRTATSWRRREPQSPTAIAPVALDAAAHAGHDAPELHERLTTASSRA